MVKNPFILLYMILLSCIIIGGPVVDVFNLLFFISKYFKYLKTKDEKLKKDVKKNIVKHLED